MLTAIVDVHAATPAQLPEPGVVVGVVVGVEVGVVVGVVMIVVPEPVPIAFLMAMSNLPLPASPGFRIRQASLMKTGQCNPP